MKKYRTISIAGSSGKPTPIIFQYYPLPYSWKIWRGIKFGGLYITIAKLKSVKIPTRIYIYTYGDPVPNRQI